MIVEQGKTYVRRMRASGDVTDALALRLRLERALAVAELHPSGLPPTAILFVRKLGSRRARFQGLRTRTRAVWTRSVADAIEELARHAARPARSDVPAEAEAVVFINQAELLSCLAIDLCDGTAPARWWWRSLFRSTDLSSALLKAWLAAPEYVPAALEQLSERGRLADFARTLVEEDARVVLRGVLDKFALNELRRAVEDEHACEREGHARASVEGARVEAVRHEGRRGEGGQSSSVLPWLRFVPQLGGETLGRWQSCLIGVGLMLLRSPSLVRSPSFAELVARWHRDEGRETESSSTDTHAPPEPFKVLQRVKSEQTREVGEAERERERPKKSKAETVGAANDARVTEASDADSRRVAVVEVARGQATQDESLGEAGRVASQEISFDKGDGASSVVEPARRDTQAATPDEDAPSSRVVGQDSAAQTVYQARLETDFGGLFYLINLGLFLGLYGDFTTPLRPGIALSVWDFVASLGLRLCGERVKDDGVWSLLASLAGRVEDDPLGRDFEPPEEWRIRPEWLKPFEGRRAWEWTDACARLRVRHPEGFHVIDVPLTRVDTERQLEEEMRAYTLHPSPTLRRASLQTVSPDEGVARDKSVARDEADALRRWLDWLTPYVRARLALALGASGDETARLLCEGRAVVRLTEAHLDVSFSLVRLPIEVRVAGLDRDPGWVPAAGRYVAFHYE